MKEALKKDFLHHVGQTSPHPIGLEIERCSGVFYHTVDGKKYYDFTSGIAVSNFGHQHPKIIEAIKNQVDINLHTMVYGEFIEKPQVHYAQRLIRHLPSNLNCVYYCTSGSETVEAALKLAKRKTGRKELISCRGSYHGSTHGPLSIMGDEYFKEAYRPLLPDTKLIGFNHLEDVQDITEQTACVVVEVVQAATGVAVAHKQWLQAVKRRCREVGALLIIDEIQTGFGRTGTLFAFEQFDVVPDILLIAKAMGGGLPIGALVASHDLLTLFTKHPVLGHINTFGGNALSVAAASAVLEVLEQNKTLLQRARELGQRIKQHLSRHENIDSISHLGLLMAVHFTTAEKAQKFMHLCLKNGVVLIGFLFNEKAVRLAPPITISDEELADALSRMDAVLEKL